MSLLEYGGDPAKILDFDIEARPDAYLGGDLTTRSITAIAGQWIGDTGMYVDHIVAGGHSHERQMVRLLETFRLMYDAADLVTGHNIIRYDLPVINGHMTFFGRPPLAPKMACDTLLHGPKSALAYSRSLENLAEMLELDDVKQHMNNTQWKRANTLDATLAANAVRRVTSDVTLHIAVRRAMLDRGLLKEARMWRP